MIMTNDRAREPRGQPGDPAMAELQHDFQDMVETILGVTPQRAGRDRGTRRPDSPLPPGLGFGPQGHPPPHVHVGGPLTG